MLTLRKLAQFRPMLTSTRCIAQEKPGYMERKQKEKEEKAFTDDITYFLGKDTFSLHDFHDRVMKGIQDKSSFKMMIWRDDQEMKVLDTQNKILSAMYDDEKTDWSTVRYEQKREITEIAQVEMSDLNDVMAKYQ